MAEYFIQAKAKEELHVSISYKCEYCGKEGNYSLNIPEEVNISETMSGKPSEEYKRKLDIQAFNAVIDKLQTKKEKLISENDYNHSKCPNCGYIQSWMINSVREVKGCATHTIINSLTLSLTWALFVGFIYLININKQEFKDWMWLIPIIASIVVLYINDRIIKKRLQEFDPNKKIGKTLVINRPIVKFSAIPNKKNIN